MNYIFVLIDDKFEWEDLVMYTDDKEARDASILNPNLRVEIFSKTKKGSYKPTYAYYKNGDLIES